MAQSIMPILQKLLSAGAVADWDGVTECVAEDFVIIEPDLLPYGGRHYGPQGFKNMIEIYQRTWIDPQFDIGVMGEIDNTLLIKGILRARSVLTARYVEAPVAEFFTVRDGLVISSEVFYANEAKVIAALTP